MVVHLDKHIIFSVKTVFLVRAWESKKKTYILLCFVLTQLTAHQVMTKHLMMCLWTTPALDTVNSVAA